MDSERINRRRRKVKGSKAATGLLSNVGRLASPSNHRTRLLSRSGSYDADCPSEGIRWKCDICGLRGTTYPEETASIASLTSSIQFDDASRSPKCPNGHNGIQIVPTKTPRQWLSSSSA
jgi:hypothetical protein